MKKTLYTFSKFLVFISALAFLFSSCVTQKKIKYLQQKENEDTSSYYENNKTADYKIQAKDNLYIRIMSLDQKTNEIFNSMSPTNNSYISSSGQDAGIYLSSYSVSDEGYVEFPILGKVFVKELTIEQTKNLLQQLVDEYIKEAVVIVKMVNFKITILGEVRNPGQFAIYQNKITIFEAIALASDLTDFANRADVNLVRQVKGGSKIYHLDLNSKKILNSEMYYLMPNDILYISPLRVKQYGFSTFPYALVFSALSLIITLLTFLEVYKI
jgi:polysaccharide biosynthesis/export protein